MYHVELKMDWKGFKWTKKAKIDKKKGEKQCFGHIWLITQIYAKYLPLNKKKLSE